MHEREHEKGEFKYTLFWIPMLKNHWKLNPSIDLYNKI